MEKRLHRKTAASPHQDNPIWGRTTFTKKFQISVHCTIDRTKPSLDGQREGGPSAGSKLYRQGHKMRDGSTSTNTAQRKMGSFASHEEKAVESTNRLATVIEQDLLTKPLDLCCCCGSSVCRKSAARKTAASSLQRAHLNYTQWWYNDIGGMPARDSTAPSNGRA